MGQEREHTAFHEAGHAVMAYLNGDIVDGDGVEIFDDQHGRCSIPPRRCADQERRDMLFILAGQCAENIHREKPQTYGVKVGLIRKRLREHDRAEHSDYEAAIDTLLRIAPDSTDDELATYFEDYARECYAIMQQPQTWQSVECIANGLIRHGRLNAITVASMVWIDGK